MRNQIVQGVRLVVALFALSGCTTLSVQEEKKLGHQAQRQVREQFQLMRDAVVVKYIRDIGREMVAASRPSPFDFRFYVVEDEAINAFALPGGALYLHTGLIMQANNAGEIAGVLAHEIGHVTARHVANLYRRQRNTGVGAQVLAIMIAIVSGDANIARAGQFGVGVAAQAYLNTFTKEAESEADILAVETMVRAGYDPEGLITMFETLLEETAGGFDPPQFLQSHPATAERIAQVRAEIRRHEPLGQARRTDRGKLEIIQNRIELVIGTDIDTDADSSN